VKKVENSKTRKFRKIFASKAKLEVENSKTRIFRRIFASKAKLKILNHCEGYDGTIIRKFCAEWGSFKVFKYSYAVSSAKKLKFWFPVRRLVAPHTQNFEIQDPKVSLE
jgi:hypothetical protein